MYLATLVTAEKLKREKIRLEKQEHFRAEQREKQQLLERHMEAEANLARERNIRAKEREREAMRKLRHDMERRRWEEEQHGGDEALEDDGGGKFPASKPPRRGSVLKDWVNPGVEVEAKQDDVYEGRDGWIHKEQEQLEQEILEAKREYEEKQRVLMMKHQQHQQQHQQQQMSYGSAWHAKRAAAIESMKRDQEQISRRNHMQRNSSHDALVPSRNGLGFASPSQEWEWRRGQAEKNRLRVRDDLGRNDKKEAFAQQMREMDSKMERDRQRMDHQKAVELQNEQVNGRDELRRRVFSCFVSNAVSHRLAKFSSRTAKLPLLPRRGTMRRR